MTAEPFPAAPTSPDWLETSRRYEGQGRAEFTDPPGAMASVTVVRVNRRGEQTITMNVTNPPPDGPFVSMKGSVQGANFRGHDMFNPCASVMVWAWAGAYTATERLLYRGEATRAQPA